MWYAESQYRVILVGGVEQCVFGVFGFEAAAENVFANQGLPSAYKLGGDVNYRGEMPKDG